MLFVVGAIILVIAGVVLSIGSMITQDVRDDELDLVSVAVVNESISGLDNVTPQDFDVIGYYAFNAVTAITLVINDSTVAIDVDSGNYTFNSTAIWFTTAGGDDEFNGNDGLVVTYAYDSEIYSISYNASHASTVAVGELATWQSTIVVVIAATIIIGLLLTGFGAFLYFKGGGGV